MSVDYLAFKRGSDWVLVSFVVSLIEFCSENYFLRNFKGFSKVFELKKS